MSHIMVDLETLSTRYNAALLAIGAVKFDRERGVHSKFYQVVSTAFPREEFHVSSDTLNWWTKQSEEARAVFTDPTAVKIETALEAFSKWALSDADTGDVKLWGNGASFDNTILSTAYDICDLPQPWRFYNDRCYRTMKAMFPTVAMERTGTHHNALDDAISQADHLLAMGVALL